MKGRVGFEGRFQRAVEGARRCRSHCRRWSRRYGAERGVSPNGWAPVTGPGYGGGLQCVLGHHDPYPFEVGIILSRLWRHPAFGCYRGWCAADGSGLPAGKRVVPPSGASHSIGNGGPFVLGRTLPAQTGKLAGFWIRGPGFRTIPDAVPEPKREGQAMIQGSDSCEGERSGFILHYDPDLLSQR